MNKNIEKRVKDAINKTPMIDQIRKALEESDSTIDILPEEIEKLATTLTSIIQYQLDDIHDILKQSQTLDTPASKVTFRELQDLIGLVKEYRETLEKFANTETKVAELKLLEFNLTEKLLDNRYW